jgi:pepsin A
VGTLYVGNPPQKVRTIFDTGSTNMWVLSSLCESEGCLNGDNFVYDPTLSGSFVPTDVGCEIEFGSGPLEGFFGFDDIRVGGGNITHELLHIKDQSFGIVTKESIFDDSFDAICGLAYPAMGEGIGTPLFDSMMD